MEADKDLVDGNYSDMGVSPQDKLIAQHYMKSVLNSVGFKKRNTFNVQEYFTLSGLTGWHGKLEFLKNLFRNKRGGINFKEVSLGILFMSLLVGAINYLVVNYEINDFSISVVLMFLFFLFPVAIFAFLCIFSVDWEDFKTDKRSPVRDLNMFKSEEPGIYKFFQNTGVDWNKNLNQQINELRDWLVWWKATVRYLKGSVMADNVEREQEIRNWNHLYNKLDGLEVLLNNRSGLMLMDSKIRECVIGIIDEGIPLLRKSIEKGHFEDIGATGADTGINTNTEALAEGLEAEKYWLWLAEKKSELKGK